MNNSENNAEFIRSSFVMKSAPHGNYVEVLENFEIDNEFRDTIVIPYLKQKFRVLVS